MVVFLIRRFVGLIFVMFAVTFLTFMIGHMAPGDPIRTILGFRYDPGTYHRLLHAYGLDRPVLVQFGDYMWHIVRYGDFGSSYRFEGRPVIAMLGTALPVTLTIGVLALALATGIGVPIGVLAAARQNRATDRVSMTSMLVLYSVPSFVLIPLLLAVDIWLEQNHYPALP